MPVRVYRFGEFALDCERFELQSANSVLKLERKPMELLILLAAKNGDLVTRAEIAERLWEPEVFVDTEHGINTAVRKIRRALRDDSEEPKFVQTVTGKGYRFVGEVRCELSQPEAPPHTAALESVSTNPETLVTSTDAALQDAHTAPATRSYLATIVASSRLWRGAAGALLAVMVVIGARSWIAARQPIHSLAMLPLENLTGKPSEDYVAAGMTDELITMLAKHSDLKITSRTSVMQYSSVHRPLREIARELGVDALLEGSISHAGNKTHVTIQLIDARNDAHLWAESYERDAGGLVTLPGEAAETIARHLKSNAAASAAPRYVSPEAHDAYLRGRYLWFTDHTREAGPFFKRAVALQPDYALGWSGLGMYYGACAVKGELSPAESFAEMESASSRAIALDSTLAESHLAAAGTAMAVRWDLRQAELETVRATDLDPRLAEAYHLRAKILGAMNRHSEAIEAQRKATELDPFSRPWAMALALREAGQLDAALKEANDQLQVYPADPTLLGVMATIYERKGMEKESVETMERSLTMRGRVLRAEELKRAFLTGGYQAVLQNELADMKQRSRTRYMPPMDIARLEARLGHREEALVMLEKTFRERSTELLWIQNDPAFNALHGEERYQAIVRQTGLPSA